MAPGPLHALPAPHPAAFCRRHGVLRQATLTDRAGNTPLALARARGYDEMVKILARQLRSMPSRNNCDNHPAK